MHTQQPWSDKTHLPRAPHGHTCRTRTDTHPCRHSYPYPTRSTGLTGGAPFLAGLCRRPPPSSQRGACARLLRTLASRHSLRTAPTARALKLRKTPVSRSFNVHTPRGVGLAPQCAHTPAPRFLVICLNLRSSSPAGPRSDTRRHLRFHGILRKNHKKINKTIPTPICLHGDRSPCRGLCH